MNMNIYIHAQRYTVWNYFKKLTTFRFKGRALSVMRVVNVAKTAVKAGWLVFVLTEESICGQQKKLYKLRARKICIRMITEMCKHLIIFFCIFLKCLIALGALMHFWYLQNFGKQCKSWGFALWWGGGACPPGFQQIPLLQYLLCQSWTLSLSDGTLPETVVQHAIQEDANLRNNRHSCIYNK